MKLWKQVRMRNRAGLIVVIVVAFAAVTVFAQVGVTPEQRSTDFYRWYLHELNANRDPRKNWARINPAVSARLAKWMRSTVYKGWDADYFIDAQDFDPKWEKGVSTSKAVIRGNRADVEVTLTGSESGMGTTVLRVKL